MKRFLWVTMNLEPFFLNLLWNRFTFNCCWMICKIVIVVIINKITIKRINVILNIITEKYKNS